jgi:hypothetical protein
MSFVPLKDISVEIITPPQRHQAREVTRPTLFIEDIDAAPFELQLDREEVELEQALTTINQLTAYTASVKRFGLTRSLQAFADYDRTLSSAIAAVPALEALTGDRSVKHSADVVVAVEASISDAIDVFKRKLKARAKHLIARLGAKTEKLDATLLHIMTLKEMISEGRVFNEKEFSSRQFNLLNHDQLFKMYQLVPQALEIAKKVTTTQLPDGEIAYKAWLGEIRAAFNPFGKQIGVELNELGRIITLPEDPIDLVRDTLRGHGYTNLDEFGAIAEQVVKLKKLLPEFSAGLNRLSIMAAGTHREPTLQYLHRATVVSYAVVWTLGSWVAWVALGASATVLKSMFACTERKKPAK